MSLYAITLDYVAKNLPKHVTDVIKSNILNKNCDPTTKQTKFLRYFPKTMYNYPMLYWMFKALPDWFEVCPITINGATTSKIIKNWLKTGSGIFVTDNGTMLYSEKTKHLYSAASLLERFYWHDISTALYDGLDENIKQKCYFIYVSMNDNILCHWGDIIHISSTNIECHFPNMKTVKVSEYVWPIGFHNY